MITSKILKTGILLLLPLGLIAQTEQKVPKGKAIVQIFTNFHTGFGSQNDQRGFDLERSYLGYQHQLNEEISIKAVLDFDKSGSVSDYDHIAFIKNAQITWNTGRWVVNGGLISTTQFNMQEKFWGHRYIMKSFQDEYKFGHSADLGFSLAYNFNKWMAMDAIVTNGEGYKKVQMKDGLQYGLGLTLYPIKGLSFRVYAGLNEASEKWQKNIWNYAAFLGYRHKNFSVGTEYNYIKNSKFTAEADLYGVSVYSSLGVSKTTELYARYDYLSSRNKWNVEKDEHSLMGGAEFKIGKYVKIAPNIRVSIPQDEGREAESAFYLNCYFGW